MNDSLVQELEPYAARGRRLKGWVLDYTPEPLAPETPWDFEARARKWATAATRVLDLGTGGGEVFERVLEGLDCQAIATEEWPTNVPVAARALNGRAAVVHASSLELPFPDGAFDLVLSRHEAIAPREVARLLAPDGRFLTQQVIPDYLHELRAVFPNMTRFPDHFAGYQAGFAAAGLSIEDARLHRWPVKFQALGHLVYYLAATPWTIPGFTVPSHLTGLMQLARRLQQGEELVFTAGSYLLEVSRP